MDQPAPLGGDRVPGARRRGSSDPTLLKALLRDRHLQNYGMFKRAYQKAAKGLGKDLVETHPSMSTFRRWLAGQVQDLPYPHHCAVLEAMLPGWAAAELFQPEQSDNATRGTVSEAPADTGLRWSDEVPGWARGTGRRLSDPVAVPLGRHNGVVTARGAARTDTEGQMIAMSADRARDFLTRIEATNVGAETLDQLFDDLRHLVIASQQRPLDTWLSDLVVAQERAFVLLEGRQRPQQTRDLYLVAGLACGLMASASQELGAIHDAVTQARTGYVCADNAGHDGLRAWIRGLQAAFTYWDGRPEDSLRYAQLGAEVAASSLGTASVWLPSAEARALAALTVRRKPRLHSTGRPRHGTGQCRTIWTVWAEYAPSVGLASSISPLMRSHGGALRGLPVLSGSLWKLWTPRKWHRLTSDPSATKLAPGVPWPSPECSVARWKAQRTPSGRCSRFPPPSADTGS